VTEEVLPFDAGGMDASQFPDFPPQRRVRVSNPDVNEPIPVSLLAPRLPDEMPVEDPTVDFSVEAALAAPCRVRSNPAPFMRTNLPNPYEHRKPARGADGDTDTSFPPR
jgi:hypothetical protein